MTHENVLVFFKSPDGKAGWEPVEHKDLPDWIRTKAIVDRLVDGEQAQNPPIDPEYYRVCVVDRKPVVEEVKRAYAYIHNRDFGGCGAVAFYLGRRPDPGTPPPRNDELIYPNGSHPAEAMSLRCGSCGGEMWKRGRQAWRSLDVMTVT